MYVFAPSIHMYMHMYIYVCMYAYMYTFLYVCATESRCSMSVYYLISETESSFIVTLVFRADYEADWKHIGNHLIAIVGSSCKS